VRGKCAIILPIHGDGDREAVEVVRRLTQGRALPPTPITILRMVPLPARGEDIV
jgi:hypothetical protein